MSYKKIADYKYNVTITHNLKEYDPEEIYEEDVFDNLGKFDIKKVIKTLKKSGYEVQTAKLK